jgi:hypothetical protein
VRQRTDVIVRIANPVAIRERRKQACLVKKVASHRHTDAMIYSHTVIPAKAGIHIFSRGRWIPAFAGMTARATSHDKSAKIRQIRVIRVPIKKARVDSQAFGYASNG